MFEVVVPATTANLGPGYDCLGLALSLHNRISVRSSSRLQIEISGEGASELPLTAENLIWQSACQLWRRVGQVPRPLALRMENRIPLSRGLGSSSAAIVGGLLIANQLADQPLGQQQLVELASELEGHPDNVAPAILGGMVVSASGSNGLCWLPLSFPGELRLVVCIPEFKLATQLARQVLPAAVSHRDAVFNLSHAALLVGALAERRYDLLSAATEDRLHQPYRMRLIPGGEAAMQAARAAGAVATMISGAGPTMLAIVTPERAAESVGQAMVEGFAGEQVPAHYLVLRTEPNGAQVATAAN